MKKSLLKNIKHRRAVYQTEKNILDRVQRLFLLLVALAGVHVLIMMAAEGFSFGDSLWLTLTTLTTVGYGDISAATFIGRMATVILLYLTGITILTLIVSDYIDYRFFKREHIRTGKWKWNMIDHIVIINSPAKNAVQYYIRVVTQIRANNSYKNTAIQILTDRFRDGLPVELNELGVIYYNGTADNPGDLKAVNIHSARHIVILAHDENDPKSDIATFDIAHRLAEHKLAHKAIAECVRDHNRERMLKLGVRSVIRPVRTYPEILVTAMVAPGSEKVLEDLFTHENDHPQRYSIETDHTCWSDIVCALMQAGLGTAMAYINADNEVICHPAGEDKATAKALIVLVKTGIEPTDQDIQQAIYHYLARQRKWAEYRDSLNADAQ
ncbi:MAG: two pore domain potassium channel family protein [Hahellaceae bacterium]|nr:two pore domain potassium channel family protein [Hahellaceae bacterium]MCP5210551.1 two pore domain potassium channel family protein [Hahellaceae bacterium]